MTIMLKITAWIYSTVLQPGKSGLQNTEINMEDHK